MDPDLKFAVWTKERQRRIEHVLARALALPGAALQLAEAMRYAVLGGGKRMRPSLPTPQASSSTRMPRWSTRRPRRSR